MKAHFGDILFNNMGNTPEHGTNMVRMTLRNKENNGLHYMR